MCAAQKRPLFVFSCNSYALLARLADVLPRHRQNMGIGSSVVHAGIIVALAAVDRDLFSGSVAKTSTLVHGILV